MTQKKRGSWMKFALRMTRPLLHAGILIGIFIGAYHIRQKTDLIPGLVLRIPGILVSDLMLFAVLSIIAFLVIGFAQKMYNLTQPLHGYYTRFFKTRGLWFVTMTFLALFGGDFIFDQGISRFIILMVAAASLAVISIIDMFWNAWNSRLESKYPYRVLAVYEDHALLEQFIDEFEDYPIYDIRAITVEEYDSSRDWDDIDIVVLVGSHNQNLQQTIADHARLYGKGLYHVPESYFLEDLVSTSARLGPIVALEHKPSPLEGWYRLTKRLFDVIGAAFLIIVLSPVFLVIGLCIILESRGPVFFMQKRVGAGEELFNFVKFRSMYAQFCTGENYGGIDADRLYRKLIKKKNARDDILPKIENDPRVTRVGRVLRRLSLDELPNLFCILVGTMSFVGPRPHLPNEVDKYEPWMKRLFAVKPGLTGYAQIFGRDALPFREEATLDLYYIQNWSVAMDLHVLLSTAKVVFAGR